MTLFGRLLSKTRDAATNSADSISPGDGHAAPTIHASINSNQTSTHGAVTALAFAPSIAFAIPDCESSRHPDCAESAALHQASVPARAKETAYLDNHDAIPKKATHGNGEGADISHPLLQSNGAEDTSQSREEASIHITMPEEKRPVSHHRTGGVALALGGGVAKGWAHIGVLRAADEFGLPISMIAGTSIGALVGGAYLSGVLDELEEFARSLTKSNVVRYLDFTLRGSGLISGNRLARKMDEHLQDKLIEDLPMPFVAVSTDIVTGHEIWLSDGPIGPAIRSSYALPGVFTPVFYGGRQLVDGALVNPVPVSVCRAYEPEMVIAVNLAAANFGRGTVVRSSSYSALEDAISHDGDSQVAPWFSFMQRRDKANPRENRLGVTAVMVEAFNIIQDRIARARLAGDPPDFTVRPRLRDIGLIEFHRADEAIRAGYDEMMARLRDLEDQGVLEGLLRKHNKR